MRYNRTYNCERQSIAKQNAKSGVSKLWYNLSVLLAVLMLTSAPVLANISPAEDIAVMRQNNVRKVRLLNRCVGCNLVGANLANARLVGADLRNADLFAANLRGSDLTNANLAGANLTGANLAGASLFYTNLSNARLDWVNFSDAQLNTVNVVGATLQNINLTGAQLENTFISIGGEERPIGSPLEPIVPIGETKPPGDRY